MDNAPVFAGFRKPDSEFFRLPNEWTDITAEIDNLAELKIIEYILRHTWGFQNYEDLLEITIDEFMHGRKRVDSGRMDKGTGLSKQSVVDGIKRAIAGGYIVCEIDDSDKARIKKRYGIRLSKSLTSDVQKVDSQMSKSLTSGVNELDSHRGQESRQRSDKERERNSNKDKEKESTALTADQLHWFESVFCCSQMGKRKLTKTLEGHIITLSASISTIEELNSLVAHTQSQPYLIDKTIQAGNLVYHLSDWEKKQQDEAAAMAVLKPATEEYPEEPIPGPDAALPEDLVQWITGLSIRWQDEHNIEANRAILTAIYRQAGKGEIAFWDHLTGTLRGKWAQEKPVHERMDYLFGMLCERLRVPLPYASSS